ncbi:MAG: hypothetical protein NC548_05945 [Lachnospiraceae bacterium]|nr:hypothetical protein [Lachnospiraceae bacterium]
MAFKYDKVMEKLERFSDLSKEKQLKLLHKILTDEDYLAWQFDPGKNHQAYTTEMVSKFYRMLAYPMPLRAFPKLLDKYGKHDFTRSSVAVLNAVLTFALRASNEMTSSYKDTLNDSGNNAETKEMRAKIAKYGERMDGLKEMIQKLVKPYLKALEKDSGLSRDMIFRVLMSAPEAKYIPKHRIAPTTVNMLTEMYSEASMTGFPNRGAGVKWRPLFKEIFGVENLPSVAISILLEGRHHIDQYRGSENLTAVRDCWDSLTSYALNELERCPDEVRKQMLSLYIKKAESLIAKRDGRPIDLRINLTRLPREFSNIARTVELYRKSFDGIFSNARFGQKDNRENRRDDNSRSDQREDREKKTIVETVLDTAAAVADVFGDDDSDDPF